MLIPAWAWREAGIAPDAALAVRVEGDHIVLIPKAAIKHRLRAMFADVDGSMAAELLAERRDEARRDAAP